MPALQQLAVRRTGRTLILTAANPDSDLVTSTMLADLGEVVRRLRRDRSTRAVILTGPRPGVFLPHFDLGEIAAGADALPLKPGPLTGRAAATAVQAALALPGAAALLRRTPAAGVAAMMRTHAALAALARLPQVVIAAIDGDAQGAGCEIALACDLRIMGDGDYRIGQPELSAGIPPGAGGSIRLARILGAARAAELILTAGALTPATARDLGLVHEVVPPQEVLPRCLALAEEVSRRNPVAVAAAKRAVAAAGRRSAYRIEAGGFIASAASPEGAQALRAFTALTGAGADPWRDRSWLGPQR